MKPRAGILPARLPVQRLLWGGNLLAVLVILLVWGILARGGWVEPSPIVPEPSSLQAVLLQRPLVSADAGAIIAARPLFVADRRAAPIETVEQDPPEEENLANLKQALLIGILGHDKAGVIILRTAEGDKRLQIGQTLHGWTLRSIEARGALFERETGDRENPRREQQQIPFVRVSRLAGAARRRRPSGFQPSVPIAHPQP